MVADWIIDVLADLVHFVMGSLPTFDVPTWVTSASGSLATILGYAGSMGAWFPMSLAVTVALAILGAYVISFGVKIVRIIASFITLGGGSAA